MTDAIEARLAQYARLIEERWRALSDGERLRLIALCCRGCGSLSACGCSGPPGRTDRGDALGEAAEQIRRHVRHEDGGAPACVEKWVIAYVAALMKAHGSWTAEEIAKVATLEIDL